MNIALQNNYFRLSMMAVLLFVVVVAILQSAPAYAVPPPPPFTVDACNTRLGLNFDNWEFTSKIVSCLRATVMEVVLDPTDGFLVQISDFMEKTTAIAIVFAILVFGVRIMGGEPELLSRAIGFLLRLGLVWLFAFNLGGFGEAVFDITDELICLVHTPGGGLNIPINTVLSEQTPLAGILPQVAQINIYDQGPLTACQPWNFIDLFVGRVFGFGEHLILTHGLMGIVTAALFSSTMGLLVFFTGAMAFLDLLFMVLRVIFIYLSSVLVIAFMIIVSPFIIPLAVFYTQERYFRRWLDILLTAVFIPMMLFAFVGAFLGIYEILIDRIVEILGGVDAAGKPGFDAYWRLNEPRFSWMMPADPNLAQDFEKLGTSSEVGSPSVQSFINPYARRAVEANLFVAPGVDFGEAEIKLLQQLVLAFVSLWIFSTLMQSMIKKIPEVTQNIVGASLGITYTSGSFESGIKRAVGGARDKITGVGAGAGNLANFNPANRGRARP